MSDKKKKKVRKLTPSQKAAVWKLSEDWTKVTGLDTHGVGGQVPRRSTSANPRGVNK